MSKRAFNALEDALRDQVVRQVAQLERRLLEDERKMSNRMDDAFGEIHALRDRVSELERTRRP